jgi:hypothetical protein
MVTTEGGSSQEEARRRGLELQAALPQPKAWQAKWLRWRRRHSEEAEMADGISDLAMIGSIWGVLVAIPGVIIWLVRRLRRKPG